MAKRSSLGIDDIEEESIDLESVLNAPPKKQHIPTEQGKIEIIKASEKSGFTSRQPKTKRIKPKSPYTIQSNLKTRVGVKELFQEIGARLNIFDQETFERALFALIEKEGMSDLEKALRELTK